MRFILYYINRSFIYTVNRSNTSIHLECANQLRFMHWNHVSRHRVAICLPLIASVSSRKCLLCGLIKITQPHILSICKALKLLSQSIQPSAPAYAQYSICANHYFNVKPDKITKTKQKKEPRKYWARKNDMFYCLASFWCCLC